MSRWSCFILGRSLGQCSIPYASARSRRRERHINTEPGRLRQEPLSLAELDGFLHDAVAKRMLRLIALDPFGFGHERRRIGWTRGIEMQGRGLSDRRPPRVR